MGAHLTPYGSPPVRCPECGKQILASNLNRHLQNACKGAVHGGVATGAASIPGAMDSHWALPMGPHLTPYGDPASDPMGAPPGHIGGCGYDEALYDDEQSGGEAIEHLMSRTQVRDE